jgi:hypothetical protein
MDIAPAAALRDHRLTIALDKQDGYNLTSSKIDYREPRPEWIILFDRQQDEDITLKCTARVTHLEYDIAGQAGSGEIESSAWIQLLQPVALTQPVEVKSWPGITREFPAKPMITTHRALQTIADGSADAATWSKKLGLWQYRLAIADKADETDAVGKYRTGDVIEVVLRTQGVGGSAAFAEERNFKGFIAYWSSLMSAGSMPFAWTEFAEDLARQLRLPPAFPVAAAFAETRSLSFCLVKKGPNRWEPEVPAGSDLPLQSIRLGNPAHPDVVIDAFSLFADPAKLQVLSARPEVQVLRNVSVDNKAFHYATEKVSPTGWATPHIGYWKAIACNNPLQTVYDTLPFEALPYKSTAKYLIDVGAGASPLIPVQQMEYDKQKPADIDALFTKYRNGTPAVSVTVYHPDAGINLPVFFAHSILRKP